MFYHHTGSGLLSPYLALVVAAGSRGRRNILSGRFGLFDREFDKTVRGRLDPIGRSRNGLPGHEHLADGRKVLESARYVPNKALADLCVDADAGKLIRVRGTAVYFSSDPTAVPATLLLSPDVQMVMSEAIKQKLMPEDDDKTTYFVRSEELVLTKDKTMARWRKRFYALLNRSPQDVTSMWNVPSDQTVGLRMSTPL